MMARQIEFPLAVAVCAWCRPRELGAGLGALSHGICLRHLRKMKLELQRTTGIAPKRSSRRRQLKSWPGAEVMFLPL
jgi:hypothetical protein